MQVFVINHATENFINQLKRHDMDTTLHLPCFIQTSRSNKSFHLLKHMVPEAHLVIQQSNAELTNILTVD